MGAIELGLKRLVMRSWPQWFQQDPALKRVADLESGFASTAGQNVNPNTAMTFSAVWSAVSIISQGVAGLPCCVYKATPEGRVKLDKSTLFWLLHEEPNPSMTPFQFFETGMHHVLISGNFYAEIKRNNAGGVARLLIADPYSVQPELRGDSLVYVDSTAGTTVPAKDMIHVAGLGWDGIKGYSVITKARQSIGLAIAAEKFGGAYWGNGAWPGISLTHPKNISPAAYDRLKETFNREHQGAEKGWKALIAEEGMDVKVLSLPNDDAQFLETRQFQIEEIARWFNIPLTKLKSKAGERPGGNIEAQNIEFVVDCLRSWLIRFEQELNRKLIPMRERPDTYVEFNVDALLRGDSASEAAALKVYFDMGIISAEFIAQKKNFPKPPEPKPAPVQMAQPAEEPEDKTEEKKAARAALRSLIVDAVGRLTRMEANEARRAAGSGKLEPWRRDFYGKHQVRLVEALEPAFRLAAPLAQDSRSKAELLVGRLTARHDEELVRAADVEALSSRWEIQCPAEVADEILGGV